MKTGRRRKIPTRHTALDDINFFKDASKRYTPSYKEPKKNYYANKDDVPLSQWMKNILADERCKTLMKKEVTHEAIIVKKLNLKKEPVNDFEWIHYANKMHWYSPTLLCAYEYSFAD